MANGNLRRLLAYIKSFNRAAVGIGDSVLLHRAANRESTPRRSGPALIPDTDKTGATVKLQGQTCKVARCCVHKRIEEKDVSETDGNLVSGTLDPRSGGPMEHLENVREHVELPLQRARCRTTLKCKVVALRHPLRE